MRKSTIEFFLDKELYYPKKIEDVINEATKTPGVEAVYKVDEINYYVILKIPTIFIWGLAAVVGNGGYKPGTNSWKKEVVMLWLDSIAEGKNPLPSCE